MSLKRRCRAGVARLEDEQGVSVLILALTLVVLLGFAAMAVDLSAAWALRRQDQSAADTAAVAGMIFTFGKQPAEAMEDAEEEVIRITYSTMNPTMSFDEWEAEWAGCVDAAKPIEFTQSHSSDCVSFTAGLDKIRVQMPEIPWDTTFGKVLGRNEIGTTAFAEAELVVAATGDVMPFGMPGAAASDLEVCLKTGSNPSNSAPCDGPDTGNFGFVHFTTFGNDELGTTRNCNTNDLELNIAQGVDHLLGTSPVDPPAYSNTDHDACDYGDLDALPYQVATATGNVAQALDDGFADGVGSVPGRLTSGTDRTSVSGHMLNDIPLWEHLNSTGQALCGSVTSHEQLITCLAGYNSSTGAIFKEEIIEDSRFGWVPLFHGTDLGNGTTTLTIKKFKPIYVQTTYWGCNASGCDIEFDPGEPLANNPGNVRIEAATAVAFPAGSLPKWITDAGPGTGTQVVPTLSR